MAHLCACSRNRSGLCRRAVITEAHQKKRLGNGRLYDYRSVGLFRFALLNGVSRYAQSGNWKTHLMFLTYLTAVVYGYGRHWNELEPATRMTARKWFYGANIVYKVVLMFNKISITCLYYRIFAVSSNSFRIACHVMNAWIVASSLAFITATIFQCTPIAAFWDRSIPGFRCLKNEPWWISYASIQISTDFALLALPIP